MGFIQFMASTAGRMIRFLAGAIIIFAGLRWVGGPAGNVLAIVGLIPLLAGAFDVCLLAPVFHLPLSGRRIRAAH